MAADLKKIHRKLKKNKLVSLVMRLAGADSWLVGGHIRDLLINDRQWRGKKDLDFVINGPIGKLVSSLRLETGGTVVNLRGESIVRLVLPGGDVIDVSGLASDIKDDLMVRDYTLNAIAWNPSTGFLDPSGGIKDISICKIRHISISNLKEDPLRLIRAYRMRAATGFDIDKSSRKIIKAISGLSCEPANERITFELIKIMSCKYYKEAILDATEDRVLSSITGLSLSKQMDNIRVLGELEGREGWVSKKWLREDAGQGMDNLRAIRLLTLLNGASLENLAFNKRFLKRHKLAMKNLHKLKVIDNESDSNMLNIMQTTGNAFIDISIMAGRPAALKKYDKLIRQRNRPLISASELMSNYGVNEGQGVGNALRKIERGRFLGKIRGRKDIASWARKNVKI